MQHFIYQSMHYLTMTWLEEVEPRELEYEEDDLPFVMHFCFLNSQNLLDGRMQLFHYHTLELPD